MRIYDQVGSLFWLLIAVYVCIGSLRLGLGTPRSPGMGFMTFGGSVLLGIFSLIVFFRGFFTREEPKTEVPRAGRLWTRVLMVAIALLIYSSLMSFLGYLINTFLLMIFLFGIIRRMKWRWVFVSSFVATFATYYIFSKWLNCQFPYGLFGL
jgi:hypothetical protein